MKLRPNAWQSAPGKKDVKAVRTSYLSTWSGVEYVDINIDIDRPIIRISLLWYYMLNRGLKRVSCMCNRLYEAMIKVSGEIRHTSKAFSL